MLASLVAVRSSLSDTLARLLPAGFRAYLAGRSGSHRSFVGPSDLYDVAGASQFGLLTLLGLREDHCLLDIGCGSLRAGRLFIAYLKPGRYFGIEPRQWLVEAAIQNEIGRDLVRLKRPVFRYSDDFQFRSFRRRFDFILAGSVFSHAAQSQIRTCLDEVREVMMPQGMFLSSFMEGPTSHEGETWVYPDVVTYTYERLHDLAQERGLTCERVDWPYVYAMGSQKWLALTLRTEGS